MGMLKTVSGLPTSNTEDVPLIGTCPNCEGDDDEVDAAGNCAEPTGCHVSGHKRVCWDPQTTLDTFNRRTDCTSYGTDPQKVVFCVDSHDIIWGNITTWQGISSYSYSSSGILGSNTGIQGIMATTAPPS